MRAYLNKCAEELLCLDSIVAMHPLIAASPAGNGEGTDLGAKNLVAAWRSHDGLQAPVQAESAATKTL